MVKETVAFNFLPAVLQMVECEFGGEGLFKIFWLAKAFFV